MFPYSRFPSGGAFPVCSRWGRLSHDHSSSSRGQVEMQRSIDTAQHQTNGKNRDIRSVAVGGGGGTQDVAVTTTDAVRHNTAEMGRVRELTTKIHRDTGVGLWAG